VLHHSQGTGLNLALASAIVEAYGGRMRAESAGIGKGATFIVELPAVLPADETGQ
jgi:two-component system sensor histidine kinase BaeS